MSGGYPVPDRNTLLVNIGGNYSDAENPDRYRSSVVTMLAYGITDRLSLSLKTSYVWAAYSTYMPPIIIDGDEVFPGGKLNYKNNGFGDGFLAAQFALIRLTPMNKQELIAGIDASIPWGPDGKMKDGVVLIDNVQTGTGGFSVNGFLTYLKAFPTIYYSFTSTIGGRVRFKTRRDKDPGDEFSFMFTSLFGPLFNTRGSITFNYFQKEADYKYGRIAPGTSGKRISLVSALEYSISLNLKISISLETPLWRDENDKTIGNDKLFKADMFLYVPIKQNI